jgi:hypothetical protein
MFHLLRFISNAYFRNFWLNWELPMGQKVGISPWESFFFFVIFFPKKNIKNGERGELPPPLFFFKKNSSCDIIPATMSM